MATITTGGGGGLWNTLGGIATIAGGLTGAPWLTALGTGMNMIGGQGGGAGATGSTGGLADVLNGIFNTQLGGGSISGKNTQLRGSNTNEELMKMWGANPYNNGVYGLGGYNGWLQ